MWGMYCLIASGIILAIIILVLLVMAWKAFLDLCESGVERLGFYALTICVLLAIIGMMGVGIQEQKEQNQANSQPITITVTTQPQPPQHVEKP